MTEPMVGRIRGDEHKLTELLLLVADLVRSDPTGGATKVNKILFFAEFAHYRTHLAPITGAPYQKLPRGPAPRRLVPIRDRLMETGQAEIIRDEYLGFPLDRLIPLRPPDASVFTEDELKVVEQVVQWLWGKTAKEVSDLSHEERGWKMVEVGEDIPYSAALLARKAPLTDKIREKAAELARQYQVG